MVGYIRKHFPSVKVNYLIHEKRENGLSKDMMKQLNENLPNLVILPDSGTNDFEQHKELSDKGVDVIILDHHTAEGESEYAVVVNPQLCLDSYPNENFAGVGITYKFLKALDEYYGFNGADEYLDLVAIGNVSDAVSMLEPETRYYVYEGLSNVKNPFFKELIKKNADWADEIYPIIVSWQLVNHLNAIIRVGSIEEKTTVFRAMLGEEETITRISRYRGTEREVVETLPEQAVRLCVNARSRQNRAKKKLIEEAVQKVEEQGLDNNAFIIVKLENVPSGFSGFVGGDLAGTYKKPVLVLTWTEKENAYAGSLRGHSGSPVQNVKSFLDDLELFNWIRGHEGAAGVSISKENLEILDNAINSKLQFESNTKKIAVDFQIDKKSLTVDLVKDIARYDKYFGKDCEQPLFAVTDVELRCKDITFGSTMKTTVSGVEVLSFTIDKQLEELAKENKTVVADIIGTLGVSNFRGFTTPQLKIEAINIKEIKEDVFGGFVF